MPDEYARWRRDIRHQRFLGGESYHDLIQRLEPVLMELEQQTQPVLVVSHLSTLQVSSPRPGAAATAFAAPTARGCGHCFCRPHGPGLRFYAAVAHLATALQPLWRLRGSSGIDRPTIAPPRPSPIASPVPLMGLPLIGGEQHETAAP